MVYSVAFTYLPDAEEGAELHSAKAFFDDLKRRSLLVGYRILKDRAKPAEGEGAKFLVLADFKDDDAMNSAMAAVSKDGIHTGLHGAMIASVKDFSVGFYDVAADG